MHDCVRVRGVSHDEPTKAFAAAAHEELEVSICEAGAALYRVGRRGYELEPGGAIVVPPGVPHATTLVTGLRATSIKVSRARVDEIAGAMGARPADEPTLLPDGEGIAALGRRLRAEERERGLGWRTMVDALGEAIAVEALRRVPRQACDPRLACALDLMRESYDQPLTVAELARAAALSRHHFSRAFRAQLGTSPYRWLQRLRIERARELLRASDRSVSAVAMDVGFSDLGRFARAFRAQVGCLPSRYRRRGR